MIQVMNFVLQMMMMFVECDFQVRVVTRKVYESLEEDSFRPILHHYDGPKFRLELNVPEAISLLDVFAEQE
jgi:hypothetical protein